jgi:hypothetical protein
VECAKFIRVWPKATERQPGRVPIVNRVT